MSIAEKLAALATGFPSGKLPPLAIERAKMIIASTVASAASGQNIDSARAFIEMSRERGGKAESTVWFDQGPALPVMDAARVNAIMSDSAASDDSDIAAAAHLGTVTSTAAIAMGERMGSSGREILDAIVIGYETGHRIGERVKPAEAGFHPGVITIFSATVAAGRLMKLSPEHMKQAICLAATSIGGSRSAADESSAREYDAVLSSMLAVTAAMAAAKGFTTQTEIFEMPRGYFEIFKGHDVENLTGGFGESWGIIDDLAIKLMPGAWTNHACTEAAWMCAVKGDIRPEDVEKIIVQGKKSSRHLHYHPHDLTTVAHSLPYMAAAAVVDRIYTWHHFLPEKYRDPVILALHEKVVAADTLSPHAPRGGGSATVILKDGRSVSHTCEAPFGSGPRGIDWKDIEAKYRALTPQGGMSPQRIESSLAAIRRFDESAGAGTLTALLRAEA